MSEVAQWIPEPFNLLEVRFLLHQERKPSKQASRHGIGTYVSFGHSQRRGLNYCHIIPKVEDDTVRYELLFYHIRTDHATVGGNEGRWFCASSGKRVCSMRHETVFGCALSTLDYLKFYTLDA